MNRILTIGALLLALVACSREKIDETVAQVQKYAVQICSFLPTDQTVVDIIKASTTGETAYNIAKAICEAVTANPAAVQPALFIAEDTPAAPEKCPEVNGVCIKGEFVTPKPSEPEIHPPKPPEEEHKNPPPLEHETQPPGQDVPKEPLQ